MEEFELLKLVPDTVSESETSKFTTYSTSKTDQFNP